METPRGAGEVYQLGEQCTTPLVHQGGLICCVRVGPVKRDLIKTDHPPAREERDTGRTGMQSALLFPWSPNLVYAHLCVWREGKFTNLRSDEIG